MQKHRADAEQWAALSESRYGGDVTCKPLVMARRWLAALSCEPPDFDKVAEVVRAAELEKNSHDVAFHCFANDIHRIHLELWDIWLSEGASGRGSGAETERS